MALTAIFYSFSRKAKNPYIPKGPYIINIFVVISFRKPVADPLATLRDHLVSKKTLNKRQIIPQSLHMIGKLSLIFFSPGTSSLSFTQARN